MLYIVIKQCTWLGLTSAIKGLRRSFLYRDNAAPHVIALAAQPLGPAQLFATPWTAARQAPCPPPSPGVCSNSCSLNQWRCLTMASSVALFSFHLRSFPASGSFSNESVLTNKVTKVLELQLQHQSFQWILRVDFLQDWQVWSPNCPRDLNSLRHHNLKASILQCSAISDPTLTSVLDYWKTTALTIWSFFTKVMSLLLNMLSRFVIAFPSRSKHLLISWLQ